MFAYVGAVHQFGVCECRCASQFIKFQLSGVFFIRFDERAPHKLKGIIDVYNECNKDPIDEIV